MAHITRTLARLLCSTKKIPVPMIVKAQQRWMSDEKIITPEQFEPPIPEYVDRGNKESIRDKRARLLYQSRKRGMLENGLLLSTFAAQYLDSFNEEQLKMYDSLINKPSNDWDIYYWITGNKPTPDAYDNEVMKMLKEHAQNKERNVRIRQPDLYS
ncbi:hypothetical protein ACJMK2_020009 [Sinanodonta woodiana]|uniref:Succinate dehydrogenase assembly factor 2, mitochondrial n=2 Tax=Sinanodonta woodiana TaxID=1069815 RepID=A0ABD3TYR8_SINWO